MTMRAGLLKGDSFHWNGFTRIYWAVQVLFCPPSRVRREIHTDTTVLGSPETSFNHPAPAPDQ